MTEHEKLLSHYFETWNEANDERREALAGSVLHESATYADPSMSATGPGEFAARIGAFRTQYPGLRFERVGAIDTVGASVRFAWRLIDDAGRQFAAGTDMAECGFDGRFTRVTGFIDSALSLPAWGVEKFAAFWAAPDFTQPATELATGIRGYWPGMVTPLEGIEAYARPLHALLHRVPDFRLAVADHASRGDTVFIRWIATGTLEGKPLRFEGTDCVRHRDGQVVENRIYCDHPLVRALNA